MTHIWPKHRVDSVARENMMPNLCPSVPGTCLILQKPVKFFSLTACCVDYLRRHDNNKQTAREVLRHPEKQNITHCFFLLLSIHKSTVNILFSPVFTSHISQQIFFTNRSFVKRQYKTVRQAHFITDCNNEKTLYFLLVVTQLFWKRFGLPTGKTKCG